ncbi:MAG: TatD family hydrolase [Bryobacteraceae bacterium]
MNLVDSHCHLDDKQFDAGREAVIERARAAGVGRMLAIGAGDGPPDLESALRLAEAMPFVYATVGVHPHDASKADAASFARLSALIEHPKVVALGEIGLDYHYNFSPPEVQREVFRRQLAIAREAGKPVIVHTREAWADTLALLRESDVRRGVFHCFSGGPVQAREALEMGFHLAFGGVLTFPKAEGIRNAARETPEDRLLVETDAPYLAPVPHRGKRNEPAFLVYTVRRLAELRGVEPEHIAEITTRNFERLCLPSTVHGG